MRKINAFFSMGILVLFLVHGILGGFQAIGLMPGGDQLLAVLAWILIGICGAHAVIGIILTVETCLAMKRSGSSYLKENRIFWARRVSGLAVILFLVIHLLIFIGRGNDVSYRLVYFGRVQLATQILLVVSVGIHVLTNIKPLFLSFGVKGIGSYVKDILLILAFVMVFCGAAMLIYYLRWNVFWR